MMEKMGIHDMMKDPEENDDKSRKKRTAFLCPIHTDAGPTN